jgi:hypothetical protein
MTSYNKKMYRIDDIDFNKRIDDKFTNEKKNIEMSFIDYYISQWKLEIKDKN